MKSRLFVLLLLASSAAAVGVASYQKRQENPRANWNKSTDVDVVAQQLDGRDGRPLALDQFRPRSMLKAPEHEVKRAKFPVVDVHTHPQVRLEKAADASTQTASAQKKVPPEALDDFVRLMDEQNIAVCVSLDGGLGFKLEDHQRLLWTEHRDRFAIFANIDFKGLGEQDKPATWDCNQPNFIERTVEQLRAAHASGVSGLKFFKEFGLGVQSADGSLAAIDDPKWDPIWETCGRLKLVVLIHTADPVAFFEPIDATNERWEELSRHPDWSFHGPKWPQHADLLAALLRVVKKHRETTFIAAHVANYPEDLASVGKWLDENPNLNVEIAARIAELGRQPFTAREFFLKYADRILFGTDGPRTAERLKLHWRFLETRDEYFPYAETPFPPQGLWRIYGVDLPEDVLKKVYYENAARLIPGIKEQSERVTTSATE
jgi:predicted TIM-barrel fold metal-dependent hydrolase